MNMADIHAAPVRQKRIARVLGAVEAGCSTSKSVSLVLGVDPVNAAADLYRLFDMGVLLRVRLDQEVRGRPSYWYALP